ncbi:protein ASPARTIC PROTEASE IN GUARD CELL 2-like [Gastrolobium bilobum]|uniref:protein ASPARTIC PROTEASE IN GUARD CELL 2-like n=1 Tax=Gastrolobium bilobum TaxID=150636 RepID=UPI002AAFDBF0|nr:protein ASPARTIC PROTEASE IN GUARD CELL 2-like [Gastrolobium bilobum]
MAIVPLLLLILPLLTTSTSPSHFHQFNVYETLSSTKLNPSQIPKQPHQQQQDEEPKWKLHLIHRDKITTTTVPNDHKTRFNARIKRDIKRVSSILHRLNNNINNNNYHPQDAFGSGIVSGTDQGSGEYFVRIGVGTPPTYQYMVIDSGSDILWVQCQPCNQCYNQSDPIFNPTQSASFAGVSCSSTVCNQLDNNAACHQGRCRYEVSYGDGSYTEGTLAFETLTFGPTLIRKTAIGCGHSNQGMFVGAAGLLGLGNGPMSFVGQLGDQTGGAFGYCLITRGTVSSSGSIQFGRQAMPVGAIWVPLIHNPLFPSFYYVGLAGLGVGGLRVNISEDVFRVTDSGDGGVVMDTGTAVTRFPTVAYVAFRDAFIAQTTNLPRLESGVSIFDTCYDLNGFVSVRVPTVSFYFSGGQILTLPARNYLIPADDVGTFCFAFADSNSGLSIIGNIQQEGIQISIDGANGFVGFGPNVC